MKQFIGAKIIMAKPMNLGDYNIHRGWVIPTNENPEAPGYLVEYPDGYQSWSPSSAFDGAYRRTDGMNFGLAIEAMRMGHKVQRAGWNGKDMWIVYMTPMHLPAYSTQGTVRKVNDRTANLIGPDTPLDTNGYLAMFTADKKWQPGWLASQSDMLADDWSIVE